MTKALVFGPAILVAAGRADATARRASRNRPYRRRRPSRSSWRIHRLGGRRPASPRPRLPPLPSLMRCSRRLRRSRPPRRPRPGCARPRSSSPSLVVLGIAVAVLAHIERIEQVADRVAEALLVLDQVARAGRGPRPALSSMHRTPQIDELLRGWRRRLRRSGARAPSCATASSIGASARSVMSSNLPRWNWSSSMAARLLATPDMRARADRLDARLLDRVEHRARLLAAGHQLAVHVGIVTGELERDRIGMAAHDGGFRVRQLARRLGQPRPCRRQGPAARRRR